MTPIATKSPKIHRISDCHPGVAARYRRTDTAVQGIFVADTQKTAIFSAFLWPAVHGGHPSGRHCAASKIVPGNFLCPPSLAGTPAGPPLARRQKSLPAIFLCPTGIKAQQNCR
jgi:hypothetical protein